MMQNNSFPQADESTLRFLTCGHVDDGKSTLIGRLLYDLEKVPLDQLDNAVHDGKVNLAQITDGLEEERAKGITIDVAYRYFHHNKRYFIVADAPGHLEYLRNMAVAASNSDVAVILVDGVHGLRDQTLRHSHVAHLFGIRNFAIVINKMDAVDYSAERFNEIRGDYLAGFQTDGKDISQVNLNFFPTSALVGDNVTKPSENMPWYKGPSLIDYLVNVELPPQELRTKRVAIQNKLEGENGQPIYQGLLTSGILNVGDELYIPDIETPVTIDKIYHSGSTAKEVAAKSSVAFEIKEDAAIERGMLIGAEKNVRTSNYLVGKMVWLDDEVEAPNAGEYDLKIHNKEAHVSARIKPREDFLLDVELDIDQKISFEPFDYSPHSGQFLLVNPKTNKVQAVGIVNDLNFTI